MEVETEDETKDGKVVKEVITCGSCYGAYKKKDAAATPAIT